MRFVPVSYTHLGAVGIAALGIDDTGDGLHQLFHAPEAAARQIDAVSYTHLDVYKRQGKTNEQKRKSHSRSSGN